MSTNLNMVQSSEKKKQSIFFKLVNCTISEDLKIELDYISFITKNVDVVNLLLKVGINPSYCDNYAIRYASARGFVDVVDRLLEDKRVDPSALNNEAIRFATKNGQIEVIKRLIKEKR